MARGRGGKVRVKAMPRKKSGVWMMKRKNRTIAKTLTTHRGKQARKRDELSSGKSGLGTGETDRRRRESRKMGRGQARVWA
jgi:hypothetical protein